MIIQVKGKVKYPITLDPSVWIFDDRKIKLDEAFNSTANNEANQEQSSSRLNKPPVDHSIRKYNKQELLHYSYVMPIKEFLEHAEIDQQANAATLITDYGDEPISLEELLDALLLFSIDGKQIKEDGPAQLFFKDGSNQDNPIKAIKAIEIK